MNTAEVTTRPSIEESASRPSTFRDSLGIVASVGCAIHCAAMPFVISYLPALGLSFLADESFHKWMALICFLIAIVAFIPGIRKHGNWMPVSIAGIGITLITFAAFGLAGECCPACAAANSDTARVASLSSVESDCGCDDCHDCLTEQHGSSTTIPLEDHAEKTLLATLAPWITPLGGLLLVSAHLLNRRFGCLCGCC